MNVVNNHKKFKISYRKVEENDKDYLLRLYESTRSDIREKAVQLSYEQQSALIKMQFEAQDLHYKKHYPDAEFLIIQEKKRDVGRLYIEEWPSQFRIMDITIDPTYRGKGIGREVMLQIIEKAEKKGKATSIHVDKDNRALNLYNRLGFEITGGTEVYHLMTLQSNDIKEKHQPKEETMPSD